MQGSILLCLALFAIGRVECQLYRLGERNADVTTVDFAGDVLDLHTLFETSAESDNSTVLYFGGGILLRLGEGQQDENVLETIRESVRDESATIATQKVYDMLYCVDFASKEKRPYEIEVGRWDRTTRQFSEKSWRNKPVGSLLVAIVTTGHRLHHIIVNVDLIGRRSVVLNVWKNAQKEEKSHVKVVTFNLWHTNPPSWVIADPNKRLKRYKARIEFFAQSIVDSRADIVLLQEVRLDNSFRVTEKDSGHQIQHLLSHLSSDWQYVYAPAMSMLEKDHRYGQRLEEGLAILSKRSIDVASLQILLLPRNLTDTSDDHSRIVLRGLIDDKIEVMTSHFSLSAAGRERAVRFIDSKVVASPRGGLVSIFAGDLNAEPHEKSVQLLIDAGFVDTHRGEDGSGLTFPACRPIKRIDYILTRSGGGEEKASCVTVGNSRIMAEFAKEELEAGKKKLQVAPETGMLDEESLLFASDHFGLEVSLSIDTSCALRDEL